MYNASIDFETYSPAGYVFDLTKNKFKSAQNGSKTSGLPLVGIANYASHEDAEVLCCAYDVGFGVKLWRNGDAPPTDLFNYVENGGVLSAFNSAFEMWVWSQICVKKYGWPKIFDAQWRCTQAQVKAYALPSSLALAAKALGNNAQKDKDGMRLIKKFCIPRSPTKLNPSRRILLSDDANDAQNLFNYCVQDVITEQEIASKVPELSELELKIWQCDQKINARGVQIDLEAVDACIDIVEQTVASLNEKLPALTNGCVTSATQVQRIIEWMSEHNVIADSLTKESLATLLDREDLPACVRIVLEIRRSLSLTSVQKLYALKHQTCKNGRLYNIFSFHGARTGRFTGVGPQPQNLPRPKFDESDIENVLVDIKKRNLSHVARNWGDALSAVSSCLRSLFISEQGTDLICSDFSAIEAVVLAELTGEEWRKELFREHGKIYEASASKIAGVPLSEILEHPKLHDGEPHKLRRLGKVAELASGYGGAVGAWKRFGAEEFMREDEILEAVKAWRAANPKIVAFWYDLERFVTAAIRNEKHTFTLRNLAFRCENHVLSITLPSSRTLIYHEVSLDSDGISYFGHNKNAMMGKVGWVKLRTYGGKLAENITQAVSFDILANAMLNLEAAGYPIVLHVHDEIVAEVPCLPHSTEQAVSESIKKFEAIMSKMPEWASDWPIRAQGGWRGKRYKK